MEKPKAETKTVSSSPLENILGSLSELEKDIDSLNASIEDIRKRFNAYSDEEVAKLKEKLTGIAIEEAKRVVDQAKKEASEEAATIIAEGDRSLEAIKKKANSSFDKAVDLVLDRILSA